MKRTRLFALLWLLIIPLLGVQAKIYLGIDILEERQFDIIQNMRVGLLTHPAGVNRDGVSTIEVLKRSPRVNLVALFGPEHGIYGDEKANKPVLDRIDPRTGLPVYSLYGKYRKPTPEMLTQIDALVIDLQDLGVRSYTYISCMRYAMEACFEQNKLVVVLDRPNPLGGMKVDGPILEKTWMSYVGAFRTPYVHGLTIAELARMAKSIPGWMDVDEKTQKLGRLFVVPMRGWRRDMLWPETGLRWVPTSPAIPNLSAAMGYAMTGLGTQLGDFSHGYGSRYPFRMLRYKGKSPELIRKQLKAYRIPGLDFTIKKWKNKRGKPERGAYVVVTDWSKLRPTELSFWMMKLSSQWAYRDRKPDPFKSAKEKERTLFNKHVGSTSWWNELSSKGQSINVEKFINYWYTRAYEFRNQSKAFWLYKPKS